MEDNKLREQDFLVASISQLSISGSSSPPVVARFRSDSLLFGPESDSSDSVQFDLSNCELFKLGPFQSLCISEASEINKEKSYSRGITIQFRNEEESRAFHCAFEQWKKEVVVQGSSLPNGILSSSRSKFDDKIEASSAKMYFHYYGQLLHQQNMLQDYVRTGWCKHVYAVEASEMADYARTLLVNERMLESYIIARDRLLVPNGKMFPTIGRIHMAPFSDEYLYIEIANKALFWQQQNYYGVNLTPLHGTAFKDTSHRLLVAPAISHVIDFTSAKTAGWHQNTWIGLLVDVLFNGSTVQRWLTTAPGAPTTHWYQLRCVLSQPIYVMPGQEITGRLHMVAHKAQSYTLYLTLSAKMWGPGAEQGGILQSSSGKLDLKEPYYRMSQPQAYPMSQEQQPSQQLLQTQDLQIQSQDEEGSDLLQQTV
ncbi:UNVERIFIED_CONTAM: putative histone-arginine methyltransferase 1.3 [Sesamum radiatum]|uniref:type I protein arginine methyltransferase n=1 Tax=Sesamum radiatum TaxID=300843 RepID=A0AAW2SAQ3_SESRA